MSLEEEQNTILSLALTASDDALMLALGDEVRRRQWGISPAGPETLRDLATQALQAIRTEFQDTLCAPQFIQQVERIDGTDGRKAAIAIAEIIAGYCGLPPAIYASVLILRVGLRAWCKVVAT